MILLDGGIDVFYIDESNDATNYVVTAIAVPFLRKHDAVWRFVWNDYLSASRQWRQRLSAAHKIPIRKELHGSNLAKRRGNYKYGKRQFTEDEAVAAYSFALSELTFVPEASIISVSGHRGRTMYGSGRLLRVMHALFQRMRLQCRARNVNAITFFDEGHPEYRSLYRQAQVFLPAGTKSGETINRPLDMFIKDGNMKDSKYCNFTQITDLVSYCVLQKTRVERGQADKALPRIAALYDNIPRRTLNTKVSSNPADGIVRLG